MPSQAPLLKVAEMSAALSNQLREFVELCCFQDLNLWESIESFYNAWLGMGNLPIRAIPFGDTGLRNLPPGCLQ